MHAPVQDPVPAVRSGADILDAIRPPVLAGLSRALRRASAESIDELIDRLARSTTHDERQTASEALDLLRQGRESVEQRFEQACTACWTERTVAAGAPERPTAMGTSVTPLALIDEGVMDRQLMIGRIAARSRRRMDMDQVDGLRARFGALLDRDWFADNDFPLAPDQVYEALRSALAEFGEPRAVLFLLDVFEPRISADLISLYADINARLVDFGVLPEIRYRVARTPDVGIRDADADTGGATDSAPAAGPSARGARGDGRSAGPTAEVGLFSPTGVAGGLASMSPDAVAHLADQLAQGTGTALASATRLLCDPAEIPSPHGEGPTASAPLLDALTRLQADGPVESHDLAQLAGTLRRRSAAAAREHGSPLDRLIIETVALVFEHVYEDEALADTIKQQLLRLQVAAFKAALIDPTFFARPDHPMRRFIDRLAAVGADPDFELAPGAPLVADVTVLVDGLLSDFDRDLGVFDEALARTDAIVAAESVRRSERLAKIAAAAEKAEQLEAARREIREDLLGPLQPDTPEFVLRFVADQWSEVVARISAGSPHAPFDVPRARRTLDLLCWSLAPRRGADIPKLAAALPQLIADLSRGLSFIAFADAERELFFSELLAWHGAVIDDAKRNPGPVAARAVAGVPAAAGAVDRAGVAPATTPLCDPSVTPGPASARRACPDPVGAADSAPGRSPPFEPVAAGSAIDGARVDDLVDALDQLAMVNGTEIELIGPRGDTKRFKLGWISPARTVFVFSRYPRDHWTARRPLLNRLLSEGRLRVISRGPGTDRALASMRQRG